MGLLFYFFIFEDDELLDSHHFFAVALDSDKFVVRLRLLDFKEDLEDLVVLVLHLNQAELLLFVFSDKADEFSALLNFVERLNELVGEVLDPLNVLVFYLDKRVTDALLPLVDD